MLEFLARAPRPIAEVADQIGDFSDPGTKPRYVWEAYEPYFRPLATRPIRLLEVGLHKGVSLRVLATYFPKGTIVGVDITPPQADFSAFNNVIVEQADQRDAQALKSICERHAPEGFDIIIDDASHVGAWSRDLFLATFPHLKPEGLYVVEDWGTAYMENWPDGAKMSPV
jgi:SAM-dependent methyltransferase